MNMYIYIYIYMYMYVHIYIYVYINGCCSFVLIDGIYHGLSPVGHTLPSEARHARSEETRDVTANCT